MGKHQYKKGETLHCKACGVAYYVPRYRVNKSKYCSWECQKKGDFPAIKKQCPTCSTTFQVSNSRVRQQFCSLDCRTTQKQTVKERRARERFLSRQTKKGTSRRMYRKLAFATKPKCCQICGYDEHDFCLDVHHIDENPNNNDVENLMILCVMCHRKVHKKLIDLTVYDKSQSDT